MRRLTATAFTLLFSGLATILATPSDAQIVTRGPYLQLGTDTTMTVRWRTDIPTDSRVLCGTSPGLLDIIIDDSELTTEHAMSIPGLFADTKYYYSIGTIAQVLAGDTPDHYFRTSPPPGSTPPVRVWILGDSGGANTAAGRVRNGYRDYMGTDTTDVWLMLGDNAYEVGNDAEYQAAVFNMYPTFLRNTVLWPTRGNHDQIHTGANNDYYDIFSMPANAEAGGVVSGTEAYYSFDFANVHFICLDSQGSARTPGSPMLLWLEQDLASNSQDWIIAYWHHPPYSKGSHNSDTETNLIQMRQYSLPILEAGGVDLVLCGHSHSYERSFLLDEHYGLSTTLVDSMKVNLGDGRPEGNGAYVKPSTGPAAHEGAVYAVSGTGSSVGPGTYNHPVMVTSLNRLGSMVLDINDDMLEAAFIDSNGVVWDSFTIEKGATPTDSGQTPPVNATRLSTGRPNPFSLSTQIDFSIPASGRVDIAVYNVRGQRVRGLLDRNHDAGAHTITWDGRDDSGREVSQGVYFAVLRAGHEKRTQRLVVVR